MHVVVCVTGSHSGTGFLPLKWVVPERPQTVYQLCACKYTSCAPYCDATHVNLPVDVLKRQRQCQGMHIETVKLCTGCGWVPDF